jgi:TrmH family RNA methyltransferase
MENAVRIPCVIPPTADIRVVLIETSHPGNIGAVARAMKNMGLSQLVLVRPREFPHSDFRVLDVRDAAARVVEESGRGPVALMFGNERTGLTNAELSLAHLLLRIPANPEYASLNLAMAVQLVTYEVYRARGARHEPAPGLVPLAPADDMERLYVHLEQVLQEIGFRDRTTSGKHLMERIRRFINRAELDQNEANIMRGILTAVQNKRRQAGPRE